MCKYCRFDGNGMAEEVLLMTHSGEHTFIEDVDDTHQVTSYRNNLDLPYVSFKIKYCPMCGRKLGEE